MYRILRPAALLCGLLLLGTVPSASAAAESSTPLNCKAYPGDQSWPAAPAWADLDEALREQGSRLFQPTPPGAVCHPGHPDFNADACKEAAAGWHTYDFHVEHPGSMIWDSFTNETCLPNPERSCSGEAYPAYVVNATTAEHVKTAVDFARKHKVRLIVHSTGHDFIGRSNGPGSLSIWIHHMRGIAYHEGVFTLTRTGGDEKTLTIPGNAITVLGGTMMEEIYKATHERGEVIVGGLARHVGIGGYITGGGHSRLSPQYGLAADQVLEMEVVTPMGDVVVANELQNTDLFWAMRGGGGSTFGVIISVTVKTYPSPQIVANDMYLAIDDPNAPYLWDVVVLFMTELPRFVDAGLCGIFSSSLASPAGHIEGAAEGGIPLPPTAVGFMGQMITTFDQGGEADFENSAAAAALTAFNETLKRRWPEATASGVLEFRVSGKKHPSFYEWWDSTVDGQQLAGFSALTGSWLLSKEALDLAESDAIKESLKGVALNAQLGLMPHLVGGKGVAEAVPRGGSNSVNPGWRKTYNHIILANIMPPIGEAAWKEAADVINKLTQHLRNLSPDTGSYLNEANKYQWDYQKAFWGDNYGRLASIKKQMDPDDVFWCHPCVGNEGWEERWDGRLCRVNGVEDSPDGSPLRDEL